MKLCRIATVALGLPVAATLDYIFWGIEEPYYSRDVLPFLRALP